MPINEPTQRKQSNVLCIQTTISQNIIRKTLIKDIIRVRNVMHFNILSH